jgi:AraC-like DNA-binding protein
MHNEQIKSNLQKTPIHVGGYPWEKSEAKQIVNLHYHDELEFITIFEGCLAITVDGKEYFAEAGDVVFVGSGVPHSTRYVVPSRSGLVQFRENDFLSSNVTKIIKYSVKFNNLSESKVRIIKNRELFESLDRLLLESEKKQSAFEIFVRSEVYKILGLLYRDGILLDTERFFASKVIQKILPALEYVNKNYSENVTLEKVSSLLGFDTSYFCRIFKSATGATFTEYLNFVRICKAEKLLSQTKKSILEISEAVGFSSLSYFNRVFKKIRNSSPGSYRLAEHINV